MRLNRIYLLLILLPIGIVAQVGASPSAAIIPDSTDVVRVDEITAKADTVFPNIVFQKADLRAVLQFFAETGDINFVVDPPVSGTVDLKLRNVSWATALTSILNTYELIITKEGNTYRVQKISDYRKRILEARKYEEQEKNLIPLETKIIDLSYADASAMVSILEQAKSDRGRLVVDSRTNSIIVTDVPEVFPAIDSLVMLLDTETPQIRVSAKIVSVDKDYIDELGVSWGLSGTEIQPGDQNVTLSVNAQDAVPLGNFTWGIVSGDYNINAQIAALTSKNRGKIIDSPEIVTLDNIEANLKAGVKIPIQTLDEAGNVMTTFYDVGVDLTVTPHVTSTDRVSLAIQVSRNSYQPAAAGYTIVTREARTNCIVDNKGALVIGGLTTSDKKKSQSGVPVLKDIPVIGRLFRYEREEETESELIIFVTPYIVLPGGDSVGN